MLSIFGDQRLNDGELPHLVPQRLRIVALQPRGTPTARRGMNMDHRLALFDRNQRSRVLVVARLPAATSPVLSLRSQRFRMRVLAAGGQRRILGRELTDLFFQLRDLRQQMANHRLNFRRLRGQPFLNEHRRHATVVTQNAGSSLDRFFPHPQPQWAPTRERLHL